MAVRSGRVRREAVSRMVGPIVRLPAVVIVSRPVWRPVRLFRGYLVGMRPRRWGDDSVCVAVRPGYGNADVVAGE
ncbi:MAG: hypothetical protein EA381_20460 [Planctomycetaceae bacterium]|nr:MAG: hypothetical protein EA381_20460 [Planctomycetaceae bacterium]